MKLKRLGPANRQLGTVFAIEEAPEACLGLTEVADHIGWRIKREKQSERREIRRWPGRDFRRTEIIGIHVFVPISAVKFLPAMDRTGVDLLFR